VRNRRYDFHRDESHTLTLVFDTETGRWHVEVWGPRIQQGRFPLTAFEKSEGVTSRPSRTPSRGLRWTPSSGLSPSAPNRRMSLTVCTGTLTPPNLPKGAKVQLKTMEWAQGLRASLLAEIDEAFARGLSRSQDKQKVVAYRLQVLQVDHLIASLEADAAAIMPMGPDRPPMH